jgi:rubredoxin
LSAEEAARLLAVLQERLGAEQAGTQAPAVFSLDEGEVAKVDRAAPAVSAPPVTEASASGFQQWVCLICGWIYDEAEGLPEEGIPPGTRWADVPEDWRCPLCDVGKEDFAMVPL